MVVEGFIAGLHKSPYHGFSVEFAEHRQYMPGDDIRNIDWKVTARTQRTHSKVFSEEKEKPALIVVDQSLSMFFGSQKRMKSVVAAELAALVAFKIQKEGDRVGGLIFTDNGIDAISPKRNKKNTFKFLERIVHHNQELKNQKGIGSRNAALTEGIAKIKNVVTHDFLVVVISDFIHYSDQVVQALSYVSKHNDVVLVKVFDPMERVVPVEKMVVGDSLSQIVVEGGSKEISSKFSSGFDDDFAAFEAKMKKHKIPVLKMNTIDSVEDQLRTVFNPS
jgi:uncharacterized protein (DUF58 family)